MNKEIDDATPASEKTLHELQQVFTALPDMGTAGSADLTLWGRALEACECAEKLTAATWPTAAGVMRTLRTETERYMLEDVADMQAAEKYLKQSIELLRGIGSHRNPQGVLTDIAKVLIPASDAGLEKANAEDDIPPMGTLNIKSSEDRVIYNEFVGESVEHLERIEGSVLELEHGGGSMEVVNEIFRCFHSIKGAAGFLGLTALNRLCHESETMLDRVRKRTLRVDSDVTETLLACIDYCRRMLAILSTALEKKDVEKEELTLVDIRPALAHLDSILARPAGIVDAEAEQGRIGGILIERGVIDDQQLATAIDQQRRPIGKILVDMGAATERQIEEVAGEVGKQKPADAIKVDTGRLDSLLEMVGELVIAQTQVTNDPEFKAAAGQKLLKNMTNVAKITANLQELVMSLRLVQLRGLFNKMIRLVRDTARKTGKEVALSITGEDTEIDKTLIEKLADPLVHLLRNAVDHGVETPEIRAAAGKSPGGTISLRSFHAGGNVVIQVEDDGKGIDTAKVRAKAVERGLIRADDELSERELHELIFHPGFSTNDVATDISGRGVGTDVVKRNITALGGRVEVASTPGKGSVFTIKLPLTMAIVDGIIVDVAGSQYVLPTLSIEEAFKPARTDIVAVEGGRGQAMKVRQRLVPLICLHTLFDIGQELAPWEGMVVVVHDNGRYCGLVINDMLAQQQVVVKNLGRKLVGLEGISGGCILGDGRVGLILDIPGIIDLARNL